MIGDRPPLEEFVDRHALGGICEAFAVAFGRPVRVVMLDGSVLAHSASHTEARGEWLSYPLVYEAEELGRVELAGIEPRDDASTDRAANAARSLKVVKDTAELLIHSSYKVWLTNRMHLASIEQSYRELADRNERLEQSLVKLQEADRLKSSFLGTVSHELRTPLTSIIGYSEMLAENIAGPLSAEQTDYVRTIHAKGEQLLKLISGLLDLSKLDSGTMKLRQAPIEVPPIVHDVVKTLAPVARKKNVALLSDIDDTSCVIKGDPERIRQVFLNLVDNALKFTREGGKVVVQSRVLAGGASDEDFDDGLGAAVLAPIHRSVEVRVADTGIGISERERGRVFDAFYQVDSSATREFGGTGLGLAVVKRITEAHGGTVGVEENPGGGSVFVVTLPSAEARATNLPSRIPPVMP